MRKATKPAKPVKIALSKNSAARSAASTVMEHHGQEHYAIEATAVCKQVGFDGEDDMEIDGMAVKDARNYMRRIRHEIHQAVVNDTAVPSATNVCVHLGLVTEEDDEAAAIVAKWVEDAVEHDVVEHST